MDKNLQEISRRQSIIMSEPDGPVRDTMIANLLLDLKDDAKEDGDLVEHG